jgi:hypothetical protein
MDAKKEFMLGLKMLSQSKPTNKPPNTALHLTAYSRRDTFVVQPFVLERALFLRHPFWELPMWHDAELCHGYTFEYQVASKDTKCLG